MKTTIKMLHQDEVWQPRMGAPRGNRNALKTGSYTADKRALRKQLAAFIRGARAIAAMAEARAKERRRSAEASEASMRRKPKIKRVLAKGERGGLD